MVAGSNMVTTILGFGMSVVFTVFVCMKLICGWLCRGGETRDRSGFEFDDTPISDVEQGWQPRRQFNGLEPILVAEIPTMKFTLDTHNVEDASCPICLSEYQEKEMLRIMPQCGHIFHLACIDIWLMKQSSCPVCRLPLRESFTGKDGGSRPPLLLPASSHDHHSEEEGSNISNVVVPSMADSTIDVESVNQVEEDG